MKYLSFYFVFFYICSPLVLKAQEDLRYDETFTYYETDYIHNIFPHNTRDMVSSRIASQIYEGLFKFNVNTLKPEKCLVEDYTIDESRTVYTFKLKKNVYFHDDLCFPKGKGRELGAKDIEYCFTLLSKADDNNGFFSTTVKDVLKGANECYDASINDSLSDCKVEGIKVLDNYTIQFTLYNPYSLFLYNLSKPGGFIFPREAYEFYKNDMSLKAVGTGPFMIDSLDGYSFIRLKRNNRYYQKDSKGNPLPYLKTINIYLNNNEKALSLFKSGKVHYLLRFSNKIKEAFYQDSSLYKIHNYSQLATHYLIFNCKVGVFADKNLRKAIAFSLDKNKLISVLNINEISGINGITPPVFDYYNTKNIQGYYYNKDSASYYFSRSDYLKMKNVPSIKLQIYEDKNVPIAHEIQSQIDKVLGLRIEVEVVSLIDLVNNVISSKENTIFKAGWLSDYPTPEDFLWMFYGKNVPSDNDNTSFPNMSRYTSMEFDEWYEKGLQEESEVEMYNAFFKAESILMEDCPVVVLWHDRNSSLVHKSVRNFVINSADFLDFTKVYIE